MGVRRRAEQGGRRRGVRACALVMQVGGARALVARAGVAHKPMRVPVRAPLCAPARLQAQNTLTRLSASSSLLARWMLRLRKLVRCSSSSITNTCGRSSMALISLLGSSRS